MRTVTRAAERFDRRALTVSDIQRMQDAGVGCDRGFLDGRDEMQEYWGFERGRDGRLTAPPPPGVSFPLSDP